MTNTPMLTEEEARPIRMILHCPACGLQHVDAPDSLDAIMTAGWDTPAVWLNPPHRSHLCHGCGHIWRPADVSTEGVAAITTRGKHDAEPVDLSSRLAEVEAENTRLRAILEPLRELSEKATAGPLSALAFYVENPNAAWVAECPRPDDAAFITAAINAVREALAPLPNPLVLDSVEGGSYSVNLPSDASASELPAGWVLVPREPTEEMMCALENTECGDGNGTCRSVWAPCYAAMLAAAPNPPPSDNAPPAGWREAAIDYALHYGPRCRDCADEDGVCPASGLPCGGARKAVAHVVDAIIYGATHDYIDALPNPPASDALLGSATKPPSATPYDNKEPPP
jgi:hypothetical protein